MNGLFAALGLAAVSSGGAEPLTGTWGTFGTRLTLTAGGGVLQQECASTNFGPILLDGQGRFNAIGQLESGSGPQLADRAPNTRSVLIRGMMAGDTLKLELFDARAEKVLLTLQKDSRAKVIRCM